MEESTSYSIRGVWEGLKVFDTQSVDKRKFLTKIPNSLKRRKFSADDNLRGILYKGVIADGIEVKQRFIAKLYKDEIKKDKEAMKLIKKLNKKVASGEEIIILDHFTEPWDSNNLQGTHTVAHLLRALILGEEYPPLLSHKIKD